MQLLSQQQHAVLEHAVTAQSAAVASFSALDLSPKREGLFVLSRQAVRCFSSAFRKPDRVVMQQLSQYAGRTDKG